MDVRDVVLEQTWDWEQIEALSLLQIKNHSSKWDKGLTVPSKYVVIFLMPKEVNID
jgi:hypothetical protein